MELTLNTAMQLRGDAKKAFTLIGMVLTQTDNHVVTVSQQGASFIKEADTEITKMAKGNLTTEECIHSFKNYLVSYKQLSCAIIKANVEPSCILEQIRYMSLEISTLQTLKDNVIHSISHSEQSTVNSVTGVETFTSERPTFNMNELVESIESLTKDKKSLELQLSELNNTIKVEIDKETFDNLMELVVSRRLNY